MEVKSGAKELGRILIEVKELRDVPIPDKLEKGPQSAMTIPVQLSALCLPAALVLTPTFYVTGVGPIMKVMIGNNSYEAAPKDASTQGALLR